MFVAEEVRLEAGFAAAQARLAGLARGGWLLAASRQAYRREGTTLARVGPLGGRLGVSRLVRVQFGEVVVRGQAATLALRWEVSGRGAGLFPVLDADLMLTPAGECSTWLKLAGVYRPPLGRVGAGLDRAVLNRVAAATIRSFVTAVADVIAAPATAPGPAWGDVPPRLAWPPPDPATA
jgi:hypothetical protein